MDKFYYYTGLVLFWVLMAIVIATFANFLLKELGAVLVKLFKRLNVYYELLGYRFYRKKFKEWVKDKNRITYGKSYLHEVNSQE